MLLNKIESMINDTIPTITKYLLTKTSYSITIRKGNTPAETRIFERVISLLKKWDKKIFENNKSFNNIIAGNLKKSFDILNYGDYYIIKKSCIILLTMTEKESKFHGNTKNKPELRLKIYGPGMNYYKNKINNIIYDEYLKWLNRYAKNRITHFEYATFTNHRLNRCQSDKLYFNYIISKEKTQIFNHIEKWYNSRELYNKYSITHKTGILLYGKPGTGKSSIVKAIATHFKCKVTIISNLEEVSECISCISEEHDFANKKRCPYLIVFEDIDCILGSRENESNNSKKDQLEASYGQLINFLDGVGAPTNTIFVATTNYIDRIDPAFMRDGRFNLKIEMKYFEEDDVQNMCKLYGVDYDEIKYKITTPICPATCQKILIEKLEESL